MSEIKLDKILQVPAVHLNGTNKDSLLDGFEEAERAVGNAIIKLRQAYPNGRDYYVKGPGALEKAMAQHEAWMAALRTVQQELGLVAVALEEGRDTVTISMGEAVTR